LDPQNVGAWTEQPRPKVAAHDGARLARRSVRWVIEQSADAV
jgi:hypothetical protein